MQVEGAMARAVENGLGQDNAIGHDHRGIGAERSEARLLFGALQPRRREHGEARSLGLLLHGGWAQGHAPPGLARRLGVDRHDLVAAATDRAQRGHREVGRSHEDDAHRRHPPLCHREG